MSRIPSEPGVYFVFECGYRPERGRWRPVRLLYVGIGCDCHDRVCRTHCSEDWGSWRSECGPRNRLGCSFAKVCLERTWDDLRAETLERAESALIFRHQPPSRVIIDDVWPGVLEDEFTVA